MALEEVLYWDMWRIFGKKHYDAYGTLPEMRATETMILRETPTIVSANEIQPKSF